MRHCRARGLAAAAVLAASAATTPAVAGAPGPTGSPRADVRLIGGAAEPGSGGAIEAGIAFRLAAGWHAYWRTPGDAGVAPRFDWTGSQNVADVAVAWPAPTRLDVAGLQSAVYSGQFVLPLTVRRRDPSAPARLALSLDYALCGAVCVPAHTDLSLAAPTGNGAALDASALAAAQAAVPGSPAAVGLVVRGVTDTGRAPRTLTVSLASPGLPFRHPDLFVEGADGSLAPAPEVTLSDGGHAATLTARLADGFGDRPTLTLVDEGRSADIPVAAALPLGLTACEAVSGRPARCKSGRTGAVPTP